MRAQRYVVIGLAKAQSVWFRDLGRWSTSAAIPCDFVKCVSANELRARLGSGRPFSAVVIDASIPALDRDLVDTARSSGCAVIVVSDGTDTSRDWAALDVSAVLAEPVGRDVFVSALADVARPLEQFEAAPNHEHEVRSGWSAPLVAVTGLEGRATSAMALAHGLAADTRHAGRVVLADMALDAEQAVLHDVGDVVPGLQELVEAFRSGTPDSEEVRAVMRRPEGRGYDLLTGLRRHRDWTAVRPRALEATLAALRRTFTMVVADIEADFEGVDDCGSVDVEDRNLLARTVIASADVIVVTATASTLGLHRQIRVVDALLRSHIEAERILPVLLDAPRAAPRRIGYTRALGELTSGLAGGPLTTSPVFIPTRRQMNRDIHDAVRPARHLVETITTAVEAILDRVDRASNVTDPVPVVAGSLGSWSAEELAG